MPDKVSHISFRLACATVNIKTENIADSACDKPLMRFGNASHNGDGNVYDRCGEVQSDYRRRVSTLGDQKDLGAPLTGNNTEDSV